jgi:hypothetical protein
VRKIRVTVYLRTAAPTLAEADLGPVEDEWVHEDDLGQDDRGVWLHWGRLRTFIPWGNVARIDYEPCQCHTCREPSP